MRVLVCGSSGCVGSAVVRALGWRGHDVVETTRRMKNGEYAGNALVELDFMQAITIDVWAERLSAWRVDTVVNCVGILMQTPSARFQRVHTEGPIALFRGAVNAGVRRIVQVSALGVGAGEGGSLEPDYLRSKRLADEALLALDVDAAVVRPALLYGPRSQSARLFATIASLPIISLPGRGQQRVQPLHVYELAEAVAALVERAGETSGVYELGGGSVVTYRDMLHSYRDAMGLGEAIWMPMPKPLMYLGAVVAECLPQRVFCRDTVMMLERGNTTRHNASGTLLGREPASLRDGLAVTPPDPTLRLRVRIDPPVAAALRASLAFLWLYTAAVSALLPQRSGVMELLARCGFAGASGYAALVLSCALNVTLGMGTLFRPRVRLYATQAAAIIGYTLTAAVSVPALMIDHCGPLAKNVLVLMCVLVLWLAEAGAPRAEHPTATVATRKTSVSMN